MRFKTLKKLFTFVALLSMFVQSLAPYTFVLPGAVFAQEATVTPAPTDLTSSPQADTPTPAVDATPTPVPTDTVTPTDSTSSPQADIITPTPIESGSTDIPTVAPTSDQSSNSNSTSTNSSDNNSNTTPTSAPTDTVTPTPIESGQTTTKTEKTGKENVSFTILENVSAPSINLEAANTQSSASLTTDKLDYAPTDAAMITGTGLLPKTTYILYVSSTDPPPVNFSTEVITTDQGSFVYAYQLDGIYRPNYKVELKDTAGNVVASTTFTDSASSTTTVSSVACMADQPGQSGIVCTANDTSLASVSSIVINGHGCRFPGDTVNFTANWQIQVNASSRYNLGLWFATGGQTNALHGTCSATSLPSSPSPFFDNGDPNSGTDVCGDIHSGSTGTLSITQTATCNPDSSGFLKLPYCTSWQQNETHNGQNQTTCNTPTDTVPGTGSKCSCNDGFSVPITVPPSIEVIKSLFPASDSGKFNLQVNGVTATGAANIGNAGTTGKVGVLIGSNNIGETEGTGTSLANYNSGVSCVLRGTTTPVSTTGTNPWTIANVTNGQDIVCTITNTRINNGSITIVKDAQPNDAQDFAFTTTGTGLSSFSLDDDSDATLSNTRTFSNLASETYSVSEEAVIGWTQTSVTCSDGSPVSAIALAAGENVTCTFTNTKKGHIIIEKNAVPDSSQIFTFNNNFGNGNPSTFNLTDDSTTGLPSYDAEVLPGKYAVSEDPVAGWQLDGTSCDLGETVDDLDVAAGETVTCTFTNEKLATITLIKNTVGGDAAFDFDATGTGLPADIDLTTVAGTASQTFNNLDPDNTYSISENAPAGWSNTGANCDNGDSVATITPNAGEEITCTFTNTRDTGTIELKKHWVGTPATTQLNIGTSLGANNVDYQLVSGADGSTGQNTVNTGTYFLAESGYDLSNYATSLTCFNDVNNNETNDGEPSVAVGTNNEVDVASGQHVVCTFTNTRNQGTIQVKKIVDPADNSQWDFTISGPTNNSTTLSHNGTSSAYPSDTGSYTVSEAGHTGTTTSDYTSAYSCVDQDQNVVTSGVTTSASLSLATGKDIVCTFTNTIKKGNVIVKKYQDNNADGVWQEGEPLLNGWEIKLGTESSQFTGNGDPAIPGQVTFSDVLPKTYTLGETMKDETWIQSNITCDNGRYDDKAKTYSLTVSPGQTVNCSIGNYQLGHIKVIKDVVAPNGSAVTDTSTQFPFSVDYSDPFNLTDGGQNTVDVNPGPTHVVTETPNANYDFTGCVSDSGGSTLDLPQHGITVPVSSGQTVTVTCTNKQKLAKITVNKLVEDSSGQPTSDTTSFTVQLNGGDDKTIAQPSTDAVYNPNPGGPYTIAETGVDTSKYEVLGCKIDNEIDATEFSLSSGEEINVTCTNKQKPGTISGTKFDENGNVLSGWTIKLASCLVGFTDCADILGATTTTDGNGAYQFSDLVAGFYQVYEVMQAGWTNVTSLFHNITINPGTTSTGNDFTNKGNLSITVCKYEDSNGPLEGGEFTPVNNWSFTLTGEQLEDDILQSTGEQSNCTTFSDLKPGTYNVTELPLPTGWFIADDSDGSRRVVLTDGNENVNFYNYRKGSITIHKNVDINGDEDYDDEGETGATDWEWNINEGDSLPTGSTQTDLDPNSYLVSEVHKDGFHVVGLTCDNTTYDPSESVEVTVNSGDEITCTFSNARDKGTITIDKVTNPGEDSTIFDINLTQEDVNIHTSSLSDTDESDTYSVLSGTYELSEETVPGWDLTDANCTVNDGESDDFDPRDGTFEVNNEDDIYCTFTNTKRGKIIVTKYEDSDGDGVKDENELVREGWDMHLSQGEDFSKTQKTTGVLGSTTFDNLLAGDYILSEPERDGWELTNIVCSNERPEGKDTSNEHSVSVSAGETVTCEVGNHSLTPILTISKSNDAAGNKLPGSSVVYTLTITATQSAANNVNVTDLLPQGFKYRAGSWMAKKNGIAISIPEPVYSSPGTWQVGSMNSGDVVELSYTADIDGGQHPGDYKDVAWAQGTSLASSDPIYALAQASDFPIVDVNFVGTNVNVVKNLQNSVSVSVTEKEGEVLGASTELPATGANNIWVMLALLMLGLGLSLATAGYIMRKRYV